MAITKDELLTLLTPAFKDGMIELEDLVGDSDHYKISIFWQGFEGLSRVDQHKLVYKALETVAGGKLHALSIVTKIKKD